MPHAPSLPSPTVSLVDTDAGLAAVCSALADAPTVVVDTEFHTERRYRPDLQLVQLAAATPSGAPPDRVHVVDAKAVDLAPLGPALDGRRWLAHGATQDVRLLHHATGATPAELLDTQLLAGVLGLRFPARLDHLCTALLGTAPDKSSGLSDWSQRPLVPAQLAYAAMDVAVLPLLAAALEARLAGDPARRAWAVAAGAERVAEALAPQDPDRHWRSLRIAAEFDAPTRRVLHALMAWREGRASDQNRPPHYILSNPLVLDLARRKPTTIGALGQNRRMPERMVRQCGKHWLRLIQEALASTAEIPPVAGRAARRRAQLIELWGATQASAHGLSPALLLPAPLAEALATAPDTSAVLTGWRAALLGPAWAAFQAGTVTLGLGPDDVVARPAAGAPSAAS